MNGTHVVVSSKYAGNTYTDKPAYSYINLYDKDYAGATAGNASGSTKDYMSLSGNSFKGDLLVAANASEAILTGYGGNNTLCGGKGNDVFHWIVGMSSDSNWYDFTGSSIAMNYSAGQDKISFDNGGSEATITGYEISGNDIVLYNSKNSATLTVKNIDVDDLTIVDNDGNELTEWKQPISSSSYLAELPGEPAESQIYQSKDMVATPTEDAMDLPPTIDETIFRKELLGSYGSLAMNGGQQRGDLVEAR